MLFNPVPYVLGFYTKKEDARKLLNNSRKTIGIVFIATAALLGLMRLLVIPRLLELFSNLKIPAPYVTQLSPVVIDISIAILLIISLYVFFSQPNYSRVDTIANKYKDGEMIKTDELVDVRYFWISYLAVFIFVGFIVISIILPIYNLSNQF